MLSLIHAASLARSSSGISSPLRGSRPTANQTSAPPTARPSTSAQPMYCSVIAPEYRYPASVSPLTNVVALIPITPNSILIQLGPLSIGWYGIGYVVALAVMLFITQWEAARRGYNPNHVWNALLLVGALALIGARLYHVIDQWGACDPGGACYSQDPIRAILPPYAGLGLYGGIAGAVLGLVIYTRWKKIPLPITLDIVIVGTLFAQGIARWGNFFNQELYGPPTDLPWGIAIDCAHRVAQWPCSLYPADSTGFH